MKILVTGSRDWSDYSFVTQVLNHYKPELLCHGAARGLDSLAEKWAKEVGEIDYRGFPAKWTKEGRRAGPIRNSRMLQEAIDAGVDTCIAFPGGTGTADMARKAEKAGLRVIRVKPKQRGGE